MEAIFSSDESDHDEPQPKKDSIWTELFPLFCYKKMAIVFKNYFEWITD
jgi:hypothetical protein